MRVKFFQMRTKYKSLCLLICVHTRGLFNYLQPTVNNLLKIYRKLIRLASLSIIPRHKRRIHHLFLSDHEMLVFANEDVGRHIWLFGSYECDETRFLVDRIKPSDICLDIGGNVGYFSLLMSRLAFDGSVHVFEPIPINAALIRANAFLNRTENLYVINAAVGDHEGTVQFSVSVDSAYSSMHATGRLAEQACMQVPMITLDDYLSRASLPRVDIIKVDVEGAEDLVVRGGAHILGDPVRRPRIVLMELFDVNLAAFDASVASVIERMSFLEYQPHVLALGGRQLLPYNCSKHSAFYNIIFIPSSHFP